MNRHDILGSIQLRVKLVKSCGGEGDSLQLRRFHPGTPVDNPLPNNSIAMRKSNACVKYSKIKHIQIYSD